MAMADTSSGTLTVTGTVESSINLTIESAGGTTSGTGTAAATSDLGSVSKYGSAPTGFVAGVGSVGALYRRFLLRDGVTAGLAAAPRLLRSVPRVVETLRYPSAGDALPDAEILAVAVAEESGGKGVGRTLVGAATGEFARRGTTAAKVVTTADNAPALAMYRACGFAHAAAIEVHAGRASEVLVWTSS